MSDREKCVKLLDTVSDRKVGYVLAFIQGIVADEEAEDDAFCEGLYQSHLNDPDPESSETVTLEELAADLGIKL